MIQALAVAQWVLASFVCGSAALVATRRRPQFPWIELGLASVALTNLATILPASAADSRGPAPLLLAAAMAAWLLVLFTYPDGRPAPNWTLWVFVLATAGVGVSIILPNGDAIRATAFVAAFIVGVGAQVWRFRRRSTVPERQATKWLLAALIPAGAVFVGIGLVVSTTNLDPSILDQGWYQILSVITIWLVPAAASVGLLAGDRAPIDGLLHAVIVVTGLVVTISWVYFAIVPILDPTWAAAVAAALVIPVRSVFDRIARNVVYGRGQASPVGLLEQKLAASVPEHDVAAVVASTVAEALSVPYVAVNLRGRVATQVSGPAVAGRPHPEPEIFQVRYLGAEVAEILVAPRAGDTTLPGRDREALLRLAESAGAALHGAATLRELSLARESLVFSREEERRRLRRDLHDDLAPTLAGLGMRAAAARSLQAADQEQADRLHREVQAGIHAAITRVREIAYDLRPPMLDDMGLEAAIRDRLGTELDPDLRIEVDVHDLPVSLPAAVELAALRIVQEAVTNVRRHAGANNCRVTLKCEEGHLLLTVQDDGRGLSVGYIRGVGLGSIDDRAVELGGRSEVRSEPTGGTTVKVSLPIRGELGH